MDIPGFALNAGGVIVGAAISWGYLKSEVKNLRKELIEEKNTNKGQEERISALRDRGMSLVFKNDCGSLREECQNRICTEFGEVKREIQENRELAARSSREISEFMGYAKGVLEELRRR
jgi:archaellum component FlaC